MRVLQINAVYGHGSTGVIVKDIFDLCSKSNIECYVASPDPSVQLCERGYKIGNKFDQKIHAILSRIGGKQAYFSAIPTINLCKYIDQISPGIVHLHNLHSNYIQMNYLLKHLASKKISVVITLHDCWFYTGGCFHYTTSQCMKWQTTCGNCPRRYEDFPAYLYDSSHRILQDRKKYFDMIDDLTITGVSSWITAEANKSVIANHHITTIRNAVDTALFSPCTSSMKKDLHLEGKFVILGPASKWLSEINRTFFLRFCEKLKDDEVLLLYGVDQVIGNLPHNVRTYGYTRDREQLVQLYSCADIFANVSREDSFSLINIEAQACGTPIVTFKSTGMVDTVDNRCSFSTPVDDVDMMYDKIQFCRLNNLSKFSEECRQYVIANHNKDYVYQSYIDLYKSIMANKLNF